MSSYQDIETRVLMLERKMDLVMQVSQVTLQVGSPLDPNPQQIRISLGEFYQELQRAGGMLVNQGNDKELVGRDRVVERDPDGQELPPSVIDAEFTARSADDANTVGVGPAANPEPLPSIGWNDHPATD